MVTMAHQTDTPKSKCSDGVSRTEQQKCERSKFQWPRSWLLYWPSAMASIFSREFWTVWKVTPISIHSMLAWKWSSTPKRGDKIQRVAPHCWATGDSLKTFVAVSKIRRQCQSVNDSVSGNCITFRWLVTAAHCVYGSSEVYAFLGIDTLGNYAMSDVPISPSNIRVYPKYDTINYDIGSYAKRCCLGSSLGRL